jgi:hypothetical protein
VQLWWHLYGAAIPNKWDITLLASETTDDPSWAKEWKPKSEVDGAALPYLASFDHRPTIAELNAVKIMHGLEPEVPADNVDDYGDIIGDDDDDLPF